MIFNWKNKLLGYANVKIGGVKFLIRKLNPSMFLKNAALLPFSNIQGDTVIPKTAEEAGETIEKYKAQVKAVILAGVVKPQLSTEKNASDKHLHINEIMATKDLYNKLFSAIMMNSFGALKKKTLNQFRSNEKLRASYTF